MSEATAPLRLLRRREVEARTGLSRSAIYGKIGGGRERDKDATFPLPVRVGRYGVAWVASEIDEWIRSRIAQRDGHPPVTKRRKVAEVA